MAKTNAQRQAAYRANRSTAGENGERRLNTYISTAAALGLDRLANRYGVTKREMLERLITQEDAQIQGALEVDSQAWDSYFGVQITTPK